MRRLALFAALILFGTIILVLTSDPVAPLAANAQAPPDREGGGLRNRDSPLRVEIRDLSIPLANFAGVQARLEVGFADTRKGLLERVRLTILQGDREVRIQADRAAIEDLDPKSPDLTALEEIPLEGAVRITFGTASIDLPSCGLRLIPSAQGLGVIALGRVVASLRSFELQAGGLSGFLEPGRLILEPPVEIHGPALDRLSRAFLIEHEETHFVSSTRLGFDASEPFQGAFRCASGKSSAAFEKIDERDDHLILHGVHVITPWISFEADRLEENEARYEAHDTRSVVSTLSEGIDIVVSDASSMVIDPEQSRIEIENGTSLRSSDDRLLLDSENLTLRNVEGRCHLEASDQARLHIENEFDLAARTIEGDPMQGEWSARGVESFVESGALDTCSLEGASSTSLEISKARTLVSGGGICRFVRKGEREVLRLSIEAETFHGANGLALDSLTAIDDIRYSFGDHIRGTADNLVSRTGSSGIELHVLGAPAIVNGPQWTLKAQVLKVTQERIDATGEVEFSSERRMLDLSADSIVIESLEIVGAKGSSMKAGLFEIVELRGGELEIDLATGRGLFVHDRKQRRSPSLSVAGMHLELECDAGFVLEADRIESLGRVSGEIAGSHSPPWAFAGDRALFFATPRRLDDGESIQFLTHGHLDMEHGGRSVEARSLLVSETPFRVLRR